MQIDKSILIKEDIFNVKLINLTPQKRKSLIRESLRYSYLKTDEKFLVMEVLSKTVKSEIIVSPLELEEVIDNTIQSLIEVEFYEQCAVLKEIKDSFKIEYTNDN